MINKQRILMTLLLLFSYTLYPLVKNDESDLNEVKAFIEEKNYKAAMDILSNDLKTDTSNREEILKMIKSIEDKKSAIIVTANKIMALYARGNFEEADNLKKNMDITGIYDDQTNVIIERIRSLQSTISARVSFIKTTDQAETFITAFKLPEAVGVLSEAIQIYAIPSGTANITAFNSVLQEISATDFFTYEDPDATKTGDFARELASLKLYYQKMTTYENRMRSLSYQFNSLIDGENDNEKRLIYSAYRMITEKSADVMSRAVQMVYRRLADTIFTYTDTQIDTAEQNAADKYRAAYLFLDTANIQRMAFYKNKIDFNNQRYYSRSTANIYAYLSYLARKDKLFYMMNMVRMQNQLAETNNLLALHRNNTKSGDLIAAGETLKEINDANQTLESLRKEFDDSLPETFFATPLLKSSKQEYAELSQEITSVDNAIADENAKLENTKIKISNLLVTANEKMKQADDLQKAGNFDDARKQYENARTDYYEITELTNSDEIAAKIRQITQRLKDIESQIFQRDMESAEKLVQNAKKYLYSDDYKSASDEIKKAQLLYQKNNQKNEYADNLQQRIETAIKMKREVTLNYDDGAYKNIVEWYENAVKSLERKDFAQAELFNDKVLSEKPFYDKARQLEIKILLAKGDMAFFKSKYDGYFNEALKYYTEGDYTKALNGFQQLLEYNYDTKRLNEYIYNCNLKLGLIAKPLAQIDKSKALNLAAAAQKAYESGDFDRALSLVNEAVNVWEDVPGISAIRVGSLRRLHKELPSMSAENERKYALATRAYSEENYKKVIELTEEILKTEKSEKAQQLNNNAKKLLVIQERGLE